MTTETQYSSLPPKKNGHRAANPMTVEFFHAKGITPQLITNQSAVNNINHCNNINCCRPNNAGVSTNVKCKKGLFLNTTTGINAA